MIRLFSNFKSSPTTSTTKVCQVYVISSNQCGSFRPIRSDSLFSNIHFALPNEKISPVHLVEDLDYQSTKASLLERYLTTYNPLQLNLTEEEEQMSNAIDKIQSRNNYYSLHCTNKQMSSQMGRYVRLGEEEKCSAIDDRLSECSTGLSNLTLPIVMVTDCSNVERLHTDIIEIDEENE